MSLPVVCLLWAVAALVALVWWMGRKGQALDDENDALLRDLIRAKARITALEYAGCGRVKVLRSVVDCWIEADCDEDAVEALITSEDL